MLDNVRLFILFYRSRAVLQALETAIPQLSSANTWLFLEDEKEMEERKFWMTFLFWTQKAWNGPSQRS
jgi:hypothetical protein